MDPVKIEYLREILEINEDVAINYLAKAKGEAEEAIQIFNNSVYNEKIEIIGKFSTISTKFTGLFYIILDINDFKIETMEFFSTNIKDVYETDIQKYDFKTFKKIVYFYKYETDFESDEKTSNIVEEFIKYLNKETIININTRYKTKNQHTINDFKAQMDIALDDGTSSVDMNLKKFVNITIFDETQENYLDAKLEIDAFDGKEVKSMQDGDVIYFHLIDDSEFGSFIKKKLIEENGQEIFTGKIENIKKLKNDSYGSQEYFIVVRVLDEIRAKIVVTGEVKARQYDFEKSNKSIDEENNEENNEENIDIKKSKEHQKRLDDLLVEEDIEHIANKVKNDEANIWMLIIIPIIIIIFMLFLILYILGI